MNKNLRIAAQHLKDSKAKRWFESTPWAWAATVLLVLGLTGGAARIIEGSWRVSAAEAISQSTAPPTPDDKVFAQRPRAAFVGDSYVQGNGTDDASKAFVMVAARQLEWSGQQFAVGGSGYSGPPESSYVDRVESIIAYNPTHIIISGSRNDAQADPGVVEQNATGMYRRLQEELPETKVVVIGPIWVDDNPPEDIVRVNNEVRSAAEAEGILFIDALAPAWLDGSDELIAEDGVYPTEKGHEELARHLVEELKNAGIV
jgi:acyl-CoA thioesterase-1